MEQGAMMPDEYGHLYEQEERLIKAATRGTPPNYRMRGGWECCHNCRYARHGSLGDMACEKYIREGSFQISNFNGTEYYLREMWTPVEDDHVCDTWEAR